MNNNNNKSNVNFQLSNTRVLRSHKNLSDNEDDSDDDDFEQAYENIDSKPVAVSDIIENNNTDIATTGDELSEGALANVDKSEFELSEGVINTEICNSHSDSCLDTDFEVCSSEIVTLNTNDSDVDSNAETKMQTSFLAMVADPSEPANFQEAIKSDDSDKWLLAMKEEFNALIENETWNLTELPPGRKAIDCKWVFKLKRNSNGMIERYKARIVVKGYSQIKGIDYDQTYSPVVRYSSLRFLIALAAKYNLLIHQMDAVTAFLQGELEEEEIYMRQPQNFSDGTEKVCRLRKSLYGLKQSSRVWNIKLTTVLTEKLGYVRSNVDQCIFYKHSQQNTILIAVYVDDLLIFGSNGTMITKLKKSLSQFFKMKDMGVATSVLGMNITRNSDGSISIDQTGYLTRVLQRFKMMESNPVNTLMDPNQRVSKEMCAKTENERCEMSGIPYQEAIGCIMYAAQISRPDISYAVSSLSLYNTNYGKGHWTAVKRVLRYLKGTLDMKLTFSNGDCGVLVGYCDADWAGDQDERRSTTGYVFTFQGAAISWATRKQPTIALSSTEAEFMSMVAAIQEAVWLKRLEKEIILDAPDFVKIYCDNQGAIHLAMNNNYQARTEHIHVKNYFIREKLADGTVKLEYLCTTDMLADILTKAVPQMKLDKANQFGLMK